MPLYEFFCKTCNGLFEQFYRLADMDTPTYCPTCKGNARRVIVSGHGGVQCDSAIDIPWFESAIDNLQPDHERRIETRGEYKKYLKDKGMVASG